MIDPPEIDNIISIKLMEPTKSAKFYVGLGNR